MSNRLLMANGVLACLLVCARCTSAANLTAQLFPLTGEIRLKNPSNLAVPFVFYSITSLSGALNSSSSAWKSIAVNYDRSGNRFIDAINEWSKLSAAGSTRELSEGVFLDPGGSLRGLRTFSLGRVWNPHRVPFPDLLFDIREPSGQPVFVNTTLALDGDYSGNGQVNSTDIAAIWRPGFGSTITLNADGNLNGVIDAADYVVWRDNIGKILPSPPFAAGGGGAPAGTRLASVAIPEPNGKILWLAAIGVWACLRPTPRRFGRPASRCPRMCRQTSGRFGISGDFVVARGGSR